MGDLAPRPAGPRGTTLGGPIGGGTTAIAQLGASRCPRDDPQATYIVGNSVDAFQNSPNLAEVDVIVLAVFAAGNPAVITDIWSSCPKVRP